MIESLTRSAVSHYGLAHSTDGSTGLVLELFIPEMIFKQLDLHPGSTVIIQGLSGGHEGEFYVRGRSGLEEPQSERSPFTASVRLPNRPKVLHKFLESALAKEVSFQGIRTFGYRASDGAEVVVEGTVPDRERHFVYRHNVRTVLDEIAGTLTDDTGKSIDTTIVSHEVLRFQEPPQTADIGSTMYRLDMPVLRDRFLKVRTPLDEPLKAFPLGQLVLIRLGLDLSSMTLSINPELSRKRAYVLVFQGRELIKGLPVTNMILEGLPNDLNVDSISAYEYLAYDPDAADLHVLKPMGRIEMLCVADSADRELDRSKVAALRKKIDEALGGPNRLKEFTITPLQDCFEKLRKERVQHDPTVTVMPKTTAIFDESLNDRYIALGEIGGGASAQVYRYFDLVTRETVAGKNFPGQIVRPHELHALVDQSDQEPSKHLLRLRDYFYNDNVPVIVTELLPVTLANHATCPYRNPAMPTHPYPSDFREFFEMAIQVTEGLEELHARVNAKGGAPVPMGLIHGDIKPENIGAAVHDKELTWKLIDFGLAKEFGLDRSKSVGLPVGTPGFMSPQVCEGDERGPLDDIFALGVTFYEVICDWQHPWAPHNSRQPLEVTSRKPCDPKRWVLGSRFNSQNPPGIAVEGLRKIIYQMIAPEKNDRVASASELRELVATWGKTHRDALDL